MQKDSLKNWRQGGMDSESAPTDVSPNDYLSSYNTRNSGTSTGEAGYITNIESTEIVPEPTNVPAGIKKVIGGRSFDEIKKAVAFRYNSFGYHQILVYDYAANDFRAVYTDLTDSNNIPLMPLDPQFYVTAVLLVNESYLVWTDGQSSIGFTNLDKLTSGAYGTIIAEDFSLIKPQPMPPIVGYYADDAGKASNFVKNKLFQFNAMWFGQDYTSSAWSTWSKRIIPVQESTPIVGDDVSKNNCIVLTVPVGSIRVETINIGARYGNFGYNIIKSVERAHAVALPNTSIDIPTEVLEAYDPTTGLYSFVFYNDSVAIPVAPTDTDLAFDYVPLSAGAGEILNGNIIALGDLLEGYERPVASATVSAVGYDPNLTVPAPEDPGEQFVITEFFPGASGSGAGGHRRRMYVGYRGVPHTGDILTVVLADIRDATATQTYTYTVPSGQNGNLSAVVTTFSGFIPGSSLTFNTDGSIYIFFTGDPYYGGQRAYIVLMPGGSTLSKSIHGILDNSSYQLALSHRDKYGRYFPLVTDNSYITKTPSFAQIQGGAVKLHWLLNSATAPVDAVDYQWLITKNNTTAKILDVLASVINYVGTWNAHTNSPSLTVNSGTVGDTYQISVPNLPTDTPVNLGNGAQQYNSGDYVVYNGKTWDIVDKGFGDLTSTGNTWAFKINPLDLFNTTFSNNGSGTVLNYDFSQNDKCTLHFYYSSPSTKVWLNSPCIELGVVGYDPTTFLVKVTKSSSLSISTIAGKDVYLRLSSPKQQTAADVEGSEQTVWYEIGERFTITNGQYDTLSGDITDGDVYFKTRQYQGAVDPSVSYPYLATDFNFSDFYESAYTSYGRPRTFSDVLERTERKAIIRYSQNFVLGSRNNGLTRFFAETIYGESDGQTSSSWGAIGVLWQRGNSLVIIQETNTGYAPINRSILEDLAQQKQYAISERLINDISYNVSGNIGIGRAKESFCFDDNLGWFIDPNKSCPVQIGLNGLVDISQKMNKYFKEVIQAAYLNGKKLVMYYDKYYKEVIFATETDGGTLTQFTFNPLAWRILTGNVIEPADITPANGSHSTVSYNTGTGIGTYTPSAGYVGNDVAVISFSVGGVTTTKNVCLQWTAGHTDINPFYFLPKTAQPLSSQIESNSISVIGNTIPVPISITGGQYSINGGAFTSTAGTVSQYDLVVVRVLSSASVNTSTSTTLTISGTSATFTVTTKRIVVLNYTLTEQASPFIDGNIVLLQNGVAPSPFPILSSATGSINILEGDYIQVTANAIASNTGTGSQLRMVVKKDVPEIYNNTIPNNPPPTASMYFEFTTIFGSVYDITVDAFSNTEPPESCGIPVSYTGGEAFPSVTDITLGATLGDVTLSFDAYSMPDKYEVWFDGVKVIDTGYRGDVSYQSALNAALASRGLPPETIVTPGYGSASFTKSSATTTATVYVYAPLSGTAWDFKLQCPTTVDAFTFTDLTNQPISTLLESNSITVAGNATPATISISGGEYSINGGAFTSVVGSVSAADTVKVRQTSSGSYSTTTNATLTIAGTSDTFSITTGSASTGYFDATVAADRDDYSIHSVTGAGVPIGLTGADIAGGEYNHYAFTGTIPVQSLSVVILAVPTPDPDTVISIYYSSDGTTEYTSMTGAGTYSVPLTKNVVAPNGVILSVIATPTP